MKKLLFSIFIAGGFFSSVTAQTTDYDFKLWALNASGYSANTVTSNLGFIPGSGVTNLGVVEDSGTNDVDFLDGYKSKRRLKSNGNSSSALDHNKRVVYFAVNGNSAIKVYFRGGGSGTRSLSLSNESGVLVGNPVASVDQAPVVAEFNYVGPATNIYLTGDQALNFYRITATNVGETKLPTTLAVGDNVKDSKLNAYSRGNKIYFSGLESKNTVINVYSMNGLLFKTINSASDTSLEVDSKGVYIVKMKSVAGEKSTKILIK